MKISSKEYAKALLEALENKSANDTKAIVNKMAAAIIKNNDQSKLSEIITYFSKLKNEQDGVIETEIISSRAVSKDMVENLKKYMKETTGATKLVVDEKIDKNLLGGVVLKYGDKVVDISLKNKLELLKNNLNK